MSAVDKSSLWFLLYLTVIRQGTFSKYDYGRSENLKLYGQEKPPEFDLSLIPKSFPLWMGYGGYDAVANVTDVENTIKKFQTKPELLYIENYGHIDFLMSGHVKEDVYNHMIGFLHEAFLFYFCLSD